MGSSRQQGSYCWLAFFQDSSNLDRSVTTSKGLCYPSEEAETLEDAFLNDLFIYTSINKLFEGINIYGYIFEENIILLKK